MKVIAKQTGQLYQAWGRVRGTEEWQPVTLHKMPHYTTKENLEGLVANMMIFFPGNEYKIEEVKC